MEQNLANVKDNDPFKSFGITYINNDKTDQMKKNEKIKIKEKKELKTLMKKLKMLIKNIKVKTMIDFDCNECNSIKSIAIKKNMEVDVTRFIKRKMLMFSKLSIKSFAYDFVDIFCFSAEEIQEIFNQY